jgi:hypothetical protein
MSDCNDMMAGRVSQLPCGKQKVIHSEKKSSASSLKACKEWKALPRRRKVAWVERKDRLRRQSHLSNVVVCFRQIK